MFLYKRLLSLIFSITLAFSNLGCGDSSDKNTSEDIVTNTETETETETDTDTDTSVTAPTGLSYTTNSLTLTRTFAATSLTPTVTGTVTSYSVTPALPTGLALDTTTGVLSGTPTKDISPQVFTFSATNAGGSATFALTVEVKPYLVLTNTQPASFVIGQTDFTSAVVAQTQNGMTNPYGNIAVHNGYIYVGGDAQRITTYATPITANGPNAVNVFGQVDFTSSASGTAANQLNYAGAVAIDGGKLVFADWDNNRVVVFNSIPNTDGPTANVVVGQANFGAPASTCDAATFSNNLEGVSVGGGKLVVADKTHHRVMIWNSIPTTNGDAADLVIGQADFTSCSANRGAGAAINSVNLPIQVWTNGNKLLVADSGNRRVLVWTSFPTSNGQDADFVLGQPDFTTTTTGVTQSKIKGPWGLSSNGTQVFLADNTSHRVLIWNSFPTANGQDADIVLGQADFVTDTAGLTSTTFENPSGIGFDSTHLYVSDYTNSRVLVFTSSM